MGQKLDRQRKAMTEAFMKAIETAGKWLPDWIGSHAQNFITGKPYRGINAVMLPILSTVNDWELPLFAGKGQIKGAGGRIKDGEMGKASWVFFWKPIEKKEINPETGLKETVGRFWISKAYQVWNVSQVEGIKPERIKGLTKAEGAELVEAAETLLGGYVEAEEIAMGSGSPSYSPREDKIRLPGRDKYHTTEGYYNSFAHEAVHSTGHAGRLKREIENVFGDHKYSKEELVAQLGAAFIRADLGITTGTGEERDAAYLRNWLEALNADPAMLLDAAQDAQKAVDFIGKRAGVTEETPEPAEPVQAA